MISNISFDIRSNSDAPSANEFNILSVERAPKVRIAYNPDGTSNALFCEIFKSFLPTTINADKYLYEHVNPNAVAFADFVLEHYSDMFLDDPRSWEQIRDGIVSGYVDTWLNDDILGKGVFFPESHLERERDWSETCDENGAFADPSGEVDMSDVVYDPTAESRIAFMKRWHRIRLQRIRDEEKTDG